MPTYQKAKPFDIVQVVLNLQKAVKALQTRFPGANSQWVDASGSLPAGFTLTTVCRYKYFAAENAVHIQFSLATAATNGTYDIFTLPSQYFPDVQYDGCAPRIFNSTGTFTAPLLDTGFRVTTAGVVQVVALPGTAITSVSGYYVVPLD